MVFASNTPICMVFPSLHVAAMRSAKWPRTTVLRFMGDEISRIIQAPAGRKAGKNGRSAI